MKLRHEKYNNVEFYTFYCPGCEHAHIYHVWADADYQRKHKEKWGCEIPIWKFNGDMEKPTFEPSLLNTIPASSSGRPLQRCHLHVINGRIEYCPDCTHSYSGKTIAMVDFGEKND